MELDMYSGVDTTFNMGSARKTFQWYDYLIFISTLVISLGIGLYSAFSGGKQRTTKEYLMGNRHLGVIPVALSLFMSYISAIVILGNTAEIYTRGAQQFLSSLGSAFAVALACTFFVPLFYPLQLTSSFEMRFKSRMVRLTGTFLLIISQILYMGIAMFSPATALEAVTDIKTWMSILATGFVATIYTTLGGIKAVVWTDVFQAIILIGGTTTVLITGMVRVGGITEVWNIATEGGRLDVFNFDPNPFVRMSFWSLVIGRMISSTQTYGCNQPSVQRYCALPSLKKGRMSVLLNIPCTFLVYVLTTLIGLTVFAFYAKIGCDPLRTNKISSSNQLLPFFIINELNTPALPGLFVAVLFCGALSTLSSSLNSLAAVTWKDLLEPHFNDLPETRKTLINKVLVAIFGAIAIGFAFLAQIFGGHVLEATQTFVGSATAPLLGLFILGAFFPFANAKGALVGAYSGLAMGLAFAIGSYVIKPYRATLPTVTTNCSMLSPPWNVTKPILQDPEGVSAFFRLSFMWFATSSTFVCVVVGIIVSLLTGGLKSPERDPRLIIPVLDRILCCLPRSATSICWCGVKHDEVKLDENGHYPKSSFEDEIQTTDEEKSAQKDIPLKSTTSPPYNKETEPTSHDNSSAMKYDIASKTEYVNQGFVDTAQSIRF